MQIKSDANLLGVIDKGFENKQGETISYREATLVIDGDVFKCSVDKTADLQAVEGKGEATLDITSRDGKLKMRLMAFSS